MCLIVVCRIKTFIFCYKTRIGFPRTPEYIQGFLSLSLVVEHSAELFCGSIISWHRGSCSTVDNIIDRKTAHCRQEDCSCVQYSSKLANNNFKVVSVKVFWDLCSNWHVILKHLWFLLDKVTSTANTTLVYCF